MVTFNLEATRSGNYYRGHAPSNSSANCWSDRKHALVFTLEQARKIAAVWSGSMNIVVAVVDTPAVNDDVVEHELFCIRGGNWYWFRHRERLSVMKACDHHMTADHCTHCGAFWSRAGAGYWFDSTTGATLNEELVT